MRCKFFIPIIFISLVSCSESEYSKLVKTEMTKEIIHDSLFLGMTFGQTQKEFFDKCWKLNKEKLVTNGANNFVEYKLPVKEGNDLRKAITMLFYGTFNEEKVMTGIKLQFSYDAWSLWSKSLQSDELIYEIKDTLQSWYPGNDFLKIKLKKDKTEPFFVKVDGNRRIIIKPLDDAKMVKVQIDDLRYITDE